MTAKIGFFGLALLAAFIFGSLGFQLSSGPSRTQSARLDPYGDVNIHLVTEPDPPKTGGIPLILHITDQNGNDVEVDQVRYDYAFQDRAPETLRGESMGVGAFKAIAGLTDVGEWQVRVTLFKANQQTQVKFTLRVGANI